MFKLLFSQLLKGLTHEQAERLLKNDGKNELHFSKRYLTESSIIKNYFRGFSVVLWIGAGICFFSTLVAFITQEKLLSDYLCLGVFLIVFNLLNSSFAFYQVMFWLK